MNEVRDIAARMLDHDPPPPLRPADEVLRVARRHKRRRDRLAGSAVGLVVLAMVLGLTAMVTPRTATEVAGPPPTPVARAAATHGATLAAGLLGAVPAEFTASAPETYGDNPTVYPTAAGGPSMVLAAATVTVVWGSTRGQLSAYLVYDGLTGPAEVCDSCVLTVHSVRIQVVSRVDPIQGYVVMATRFLVGGRLTVVSAQGLPVDDPRYGPPLAAPLLDGPAVAALAADPKMLP